MTRNSSISRRAGDAGSPPSLRQAVVARAWADFKTSLALFFFATTLVMGANAIRFRYGDVRDFYAYNGSSGPYTVDDIAGSPATGRPEREFRPGDRVGWIASVCVNPGVSYTAHIFLMHVEEENVKTAVVSKDVHYAADSHRCGPKLAWMRLPLSSPPGRYLIHRYTTLREGTWWPLTGTFEDIPFTVVDGPASVKQDGM